MANFGATRVNLEANATGKIVDVLFFREQWVGRLLYLNPSRIKTVNEGIKRVNAEGGQSATVGEADVVKDAYINGRGDQRVGSRWKNIINRVGAVILNVTECTGVVR